MPKIENENDKYGGTGYEIRQIVFPVWAALYCRRKNQEMEGPPQSNQSTQEQAAVSGINCGYVQQAGASQQPVQFQNFAGPGQISSNGNLQPLYYGANPYQNQGYLYLQDPMKVAYATPYPTSTVPQLYGGNNFSTLQQPVMVVQQQPTSVPINATVRTSSGDNYLTLSVLMTFLVFIIGGWPSLLCTISALFMSYNAKDEEKRGNIAAAKAKANISLGLNVTAVVFVIVMWSVVAIPVAVTVSAQAATPSPTPYCYSYCYISSCYYNNYYYYSPCYNYYSYASTSYSYSSYSYNYFFSQSCSPAYGQSCSNG